MPINQASKDSLKPQGMQHAFTLAEVLITLAIIGIVAAMTMPILVQNTQEKITVVALKKAYSTLSQAYKMAESNNGTPDTWNLLGSLSAQGAENALNMLAPYLNVAKNCGTNYSDCFTENYYCLDGSKNGQSGCYVSVDGNFGGGSASLKLADGSLVNIFIRNEKCSDSQGPTMALSNNCADIQVDTNGNKKPNTLGKDLFRFHLTKYGIIPKGVAQENSISTFAGNCINGDAGWGEACTAWVLYNENMDYLKCSNLAWDGKHKCD